MATTTIKSALQVQTSASGVNQTVGGLNKVGNAINNVQKSGNALNRNQTRLAQTSASAGRSFAAQANGMGGLVGAYAGAAATVIALQQAFAALTSAAQSETIIQGTKTLALEIGQSGPRIIKSIQEITQGQLTLTEAAQSANIALSSGFNTKQIEGFTTVALKASRALGRDFTDAMQRITRGVSKLEPELLDELGIFTRIEPAVQKYARQLGVSAKSLNEFQRRQAFANAAIEEGMRKFSSIDTTSASTQKSLEQLRVQISELGTEFTKLLVAVLAPLADFFTNNIGNALALFGGIVAMVFRKALQEITSFTSAANAKLISFFGSMADRFSKVDFPVFEKLQEELKKSAKQGGQGLVGPMASGKDVAINKAFTAALKAQKEGLVTTVSELRQTNIVYRQQLDNLTQSGKDNTKTFTNLKLAIERNEKAILTAGKGTEKFIKLMGFLETSATLAGKAMNGLMTAFSIIGIGIAASQLVLSMFGVDILGKLQDYFTETSTAAANFGNAVAGMAAVAAGGGNKLYESLKRAGASAEYLEQVPQKLQDARAAVVEATKQDIIANTKGPAPKAQFTMVSVTDAKALATALKLYNEQLAIAVNTSYSAEARQEARQLAIEYQAVAESIKQFGMAATQVIGDISNQTGMSAEQVAAAWKDNIFGSIDKSVGAMRIFGIELANIDGKSTLEGLTEEQLKVVEAVFLSSNSIKELDSALLSGNVNSQQLGSSIAGLSSNYILLSEEAANVVRQLKSSGAPLGVIAAKQAEYNAQLKELKSNIDVYKQIETRLIAVETVFKSLNSTFGSQISKLDSLYSGGLVDSTGKIATSQEQINKNQIQYLNTIIKTYAASSRALENQYEMNRLIAEGAKLGISEREIRATVTAEAEAYQLALKAAAGTAVELQQEVQNFVNDMVSSFMDVKREIIALEREGEKIQLQISAELDDASFASAINEIQNRISDSEANIALYTAQEKNKTIDPVTAAQKVADEELKIFDARVELANIEYDRTIAKIGHDLNMIELEAEIAASEILSRRDLAIQEANSRAMALKAQVNAFSSFISSQNSANANFAKDLADVFYQGAVSVQNALGQYGGLATAVTSNYQAAIFDGQVQLDAITAGLKLYTDGIKEKSDVELKNLELETEAKREAARREADQATINHEAYMGRLATERQAVIENGEASVKAAEEAGSKAGKEAEKLAEKQRELSKDLIKQYEDQQQKVRDAITQVVSDISDFIGNIITTSQQAKVERLKAREEFTTSRLASVTEQLSDVQSSLTESLDEEASLRETLVEQTRDLNAAQKEFLKGLGSQEANILENSSAYVESLLAQKDSILALDKQVRKSVALEEEAKLLEQSQVAIQQELTAVTQSRVAAEERLASTENMLSGITDLLSAKSDGLAKSFQTLLDAMSALEAMSAQVSGVAAQAGTQNLYGEFSDAVEKFNDTIADLKEVGGFKVDAAGNKVASTKAIDMLNKGVALLGSAMEGWNIGSGVGALLFGGNKSASLGSSMGGAIGKLLAASSFGPSITNGIVAGATKLLGSTAGSLLGAASSFILPVIGSILGGLLGKLFSKTPKASASGTLTSAGFDYTETSRRKVSQEGLEALGSIMTSTLRGIVSSLRQVGINFGDVLDTSIKLKKDSINYASLQFEGGKLFEAEKLGKGEEGAKAAAEFFTDSFFKGLRIERNSRGLVTFRSLVVDALVPNAADLQRAIDRFMGKAEELRTKDTFTKAVEFAGNFRTELDKLAVNGINVVDTYRKVNTAAVANGNSIANFYKKFLKDTRDTFGEFSNQYADATKAIRTNVLAQAGLAEISTKSGKQLVSLSSQMNTVNAGALAVRDLVASIQGLRPALRAAGVEKIGQVIIKAINVQVTEMVVETARTLNRSIALLRNPAREAVFTLQDMVENGAERIKNLGGVANRLITEQNNGVKGITDAQINSAKKNYENAKLLLGLELETYITSLSEAELQAVASSNLLSEGIKALAARQLVLLKVISAQKAIATLIQSTKDLNAALFNLTDSISFLRFKGILGIAMDAQSLAEALNIPTLGGFVTQFNTILNRIAAGTNVAREYARAISYAETQLANNKLTSQQYADALKILNDTTIEYLNTLDDFVEQYKDTIKSISELLVNARDTVSNAISALSDRVISAFDEMVSASTELVNAYDNIVDQIKNSSEKLFDLQESAADALTSAQEALSEFEKENDLSGRTSAQVAAALADVQSQIQALLSQPVDLASFMDISRLTSEQRSLQNELERITELEAEYSKLLADKAAAQTDADFVNNLIDQAGSLLETRQDESDIVREAKAAYDQLVQSQSDMVDFTNALAEANLDLNTLRTSESEIIRTTTASIEKYTKGLLDLQGAISGAYMLSPEEAKTTARLNTKLAYDLMATNEEKIAALRAEGITEYSSIQEGILMAINKAGQEAYSAATSIQDLAQNLTALENGSITLSRFVELSSDVEGAFSDLLDAFGSEPATLVQNLDSAMTDLYDTIRGINGTSGLIDSISYYNSALADNSTNIDTLTNNFNKLETVLAGMTGTDGALEAVVSAVAGLASEIEAAWKDVEFTANTLLTSGGAINVQMPEGGALSATDSGNLKIIADAAIAFQQWLGQNPTGSAVGGLITGPGTSTSDSVPKWLSTGEYVIKAASVRKFGTSLFDSLNAGQYPAMETGSPVEISNPITMQSPQAVSTQQDIEVEVNIINNGTPQTTIATPDIRKVGGKLVVDVVLDDFKNNGPIARQVRSLRK